MGFVTPGHVFIPMGQGSMHVRMYFLKIILETHIWLCWNFVFDRMCTYQLKEDYVNNITAIFWNFLWGLYNIVFS